MGEVIKLRQYGGRREDRDRLFRAILQGEEFESGAMHGTRGQHFHHHGEIGRLPDDWAEVLRGDAPDYIVWSYDTPIAWHYRDDDDDSERSGKDVWVVPEVRYSATTTRHQNLVRTALIFHELEPITRVTEA